MGLLQKKIDLNVKKILFLEDLSLIETFYKYLALMR